jgi:uncharacterized GH25 family protein
MRILSLIFLTAAASVTDFSSAIAHDTWVEVNSTEVRLGQVVHVDLKLGNHGNDHRDFKLASKITLEPCTLAVVDPEGQSHDLKSRAVDTGFAPSEGNWVLAVVHHMAPDEKGEKFEKTAYSATLTFNVAELLP